MIKVLFQNRMVKIAVLTTIIMMLNSFSDMAYAFDPLEDNHLTAQSFLANDVQNSEKNKNHMQSGDLPDVSTIDKTAMVPESSVDFLSGKIRQQNIVDNVRFFINTQGAGIVTLDLPDAHTIVNITEEKSRKIQLTIRDHTWDATQIRQTDMTNFATPVSTIETVNINEQASINVVMQSDYEYGLQHIDSRYQLVIEPKAVAAAQNTGSDQRDDRISLKFQDVDVRIFMQVIADFAGLNIIVKESVTDNISIFLKNISYEQALKAVLQAKKLAKKQIGTVVFIMPDSEYKRDFRQPGQVSEIIQLNHTKAQHIAERITVEVHTDTNQRYLSEHGSIKVDSYLNVLIVRDTPEHMARLKKFIQAIDKPPLPQIQISTQIMLVEDRVISDLDKWHDGEPIYPNRWCHDNLCQDLPLPKSVGSILRSGFPIFQKLNAMQAQGYGEILASPTITTTDRNQAYIRQGSEPMCLTSLSDESQFSEDIIEFDVTPTITPDHKISMEILVKKETIHPDKNSELKTIKYGESYEIIVQDGQTILINGVYTYSSSNYQNKGSLVGDLPWLKNFFKKQSNQDTKVKVIILLTPNIVK